MLFQDPSMDYYCAKQYSTSNMNQHEKINYLELPASDLATIKAFFVEVFGWAFEDYGPEYTAFSNAGLAGGFYKSDLNSDADKGSALVVFYSHDLGQTQQKIKAAGGTISKSQFSFPGGRRFHFKDPNNNEFAVWSDIT